MTSEELIRVKNFIVHSNISHNYTKIDPNKKKIALILSNLSFYILLEKLKR